MPSLVLALACLVAWNWPAPVSAAGPERADAPVASPPSAFSFAVTGDMRNFTGPGPDGKRYFDGACEALQVVGGGAFMISPGDCDPPGPVRATLDRYLGTNYLWYPVAGNHETTSAGTMTWLRRWSAKGIPHLVRHGPPGAENTTYSFDYANSHFVMLNEYYDGRADTSRGDDLPDVALQWLEDDLGATHQQLIWVVGHKPIESMPDMDTGRVRHPKDSVSGHADQVTRFLQILSRHHARAYLCGHTHNASVSRVHGLWQLDSGHARGGGDRGAPSTFLKVRVAGHDTWVDVYRADPKGLHYELKKTVALTSD